MVTEILKRNCLEDRVSALEEAGLSLQERYAGLIAVELDRFSELYSGRFGAAAASLAAQVRAVGAKAIAEAELPWPTGSDPLPTLNDVQDPVFIADVRHLLLLSDDPVHEAILPALLKWAERRTDLRTVELAHKEIEENLDIIVQAPRRTTLNPRYYVVRSGETMRYISAAVLGDSERWMDLIQLYDLEPPYLSEQPSKGKLSPGTKLLLPPDADQGEIEGLGETFSLQTEPDARGWGQVWDLVDQEGVGLAAEVGLQAFATDLALRLATPYGSLQGIPEYGVVPVAGFPASEMGILTEVVAIDALREDERVGRVQVVATMKAVEQPGVFVGTVYVSPRPELLTG